MKGKPNPRKGTGLLAWRSRQKPGAIMRPSTFENIKREAKKRGYRNPEAVAGSAYWKTVKAKFKKRPSGSGLFSNKELNQGYKVLE